MEFLKYAPEWCANRPAADTWRVTILGLSRLPGMLRGRLSLPNRLDFACAGRLQQGEAFARGLLRIQVALSFVLDLQAGPFVRIHGLEVGSFELAIGGRLR